MLTLVVEDDKDYADIIAQTLRRASHDVVTFASVREASTFAQRKCPDLAVLDVALPDGTGMDICKSLRKLNPDVGVIMLSSLDRQSDIVTGLDAGADDYLTKPFHPGELLARVNAITRRSLGKPAVERFGEPCISAGGLDVDVTGQTAALNGVNLNCTKLEVEILAQLMRYSGQALSHSFLTETVWGYKNMSDATLLKGHISSIRRKIKDAGGREETIRTVHGVGYSFNPA